MCKFQKNKPSWKELLLIREIIATSCIPISPFSCILLHAAPCPWTSFFEPLTLPSWWYSPCLKFSPEVSPRQAAELNNPELDNGFALKCLALATSVYSCKHGNQLHHSVSSSLNCISWLDKNLLRLEWYCCRYSIPVALSPQTPLCPLVKPYRCSYMNSTQSCKILSDKNLTVIPSWYLVS